MVGGERAAPEFPRQFSSVSGSRLDTAESGSRDLEGERASLKSFAYVPWPKVSVIIPTLNEARNLPHVFSKLPTALHEIIMVDGHSVDDTVAIARRLRPDVHIIMQSRSGKGNALACGFAAATGDIIAMVDADGSADPAEIPRFVKALLDGADFAKGTRFAPAVAARHHPSTSSRKSVSSVSSSTSCAARTIRTCATGITPSGAAMSPCSGLMRNHPSPPTDANLGRRIRSRDPDQYPHRPSRAECHRGPQL